MRLRFARLGFPRHWTFPAALGCAALLLASCASTQPVAAPTGSEAPPQLEAGKTITVRYCNDQTARISAPEHFDGKAPVAVYVHGGSWISGDHDTGGFIIDQIGPALTEDGFVVANVNYRLGPDHYWPAQIEDVMCAVRYLRAHAASLQIDPDRIGAWGHSAGGHLVAMLGTAASEAGWDKGPYQSESSAVEAVVDLSGPSNLATMSTEGASGYVRDTFVGLLGPVPADELPQALLEASPVHYVSSSDPPFLIIHGDEDTIVYPQQSEELYAALRSAGVRATLVIVTGGAHELNEPGAEPEPDAITQMVVDFFSSHLDRAGGAG